MARADKVEIVAILKAKIDAAKGVYFADFQGLDVAQATELRNRCRDAGVEFEVVKNTMTRRALGEEAATELAEVLTGPTAIATSTEDEILPAKVISDFVKEFELPRLKGGLLDGKLVPEAQVAILAKLPSKDVLLGRFAAGLISPVQNMASALASPLSKLATALKQVAEQKG